MELKPEKESIIEIVYDDGRKGIVFKSELSECPVCKTNSVRAKQLFEGGGVVCITQGCSYWFCL